MRGRRRGRRLSYVERRVYLKSPKTNLPRTLRIDDRTVGALRTRRREQAEHELAWPGPWRNEWGLVFTHEDGAFVDPSLLSDAFRRLVRASSLPSLSPTRRKPPPDHPARHLLRNFLHC